MKLLFVDESSDSKFKYHLTVCVAIVDATNYRSIKSEFQEVLRKSSWDESVEFKGSHIFCATKGDTSVSIEERVRIARHLLEVNIAVTNARMSFLLGMDDRATDQKASYLTMIPLLVQKALPKAKKKGGKDLVLVSCDRRSDISASEIEKVIGPALTVKGYTLVERVETPTSSFDTVGILYADIVAYLGARIQTISNDAELFDSIPPEEWEGNGKIRKMKSSTELLKKLKKLERLELKARLE